MIAVEENEVRRPYVALDDLERLAADEALDLGTIFDQLRVVFDSWRPRTSDVFVRPREV
jgi:hypothetical protein